MPGPVATKTFGVLKPYLVLPGPDTYVKSALKTVGIADETVGYPIHTFKVLFEDFCEYFLPSSIPTLKIFVLKNSQNLRNMFN